MTRRTALKSIGISAAALAAGARFHKTVAQEITPQFQTFHEFMRRHVPATNIPTIAICGKLGTGKTWVAKRLAESVYPNAYILDTDQEASESMDYFRGIASIVRHDITDNGTVTIAEGTKKLVKEMRKLKQAVGRLHRKEGAAIFVPYPLGEAIVKGGDAIPQSITSHADVTIHIHRSGRFPGEFWAAVIANRFGPKSVAFNITEPEA